MRRINAGVNVFEMIIGITIVDTENRDGPALRVIVSVTVTNRPTSNLISRPSSRGNCSRCRPRT